MLQEAPAKTLIERKKDEGKGREETGREKWKGMRKESKKTVGKGREKQRDGKGKEI